MAHKKGVGSTKNGRDSKPNFLGVKSADGQTITAGSIIVRQRGTRIFPGDNVSRGKDDTLFSLIDGKVKFHRKGKTKKRTFTKETNHKNLKTLSQNIISICHSNHIKQH